MADNHTARMFAWQRQALSDHELQPLAQKVVSFLMAYIHRDTGDAWLGQRRIYDELGASRRGVQKAIRLPGGSDRTNSDSVPVAVRGC